MTLTSQETMEANALFTLWQNIKKQESDLEKFEKDTGELVLNCYLRGAQASPAELQDVVAVFRQMEAEITGFLAANPDAGFERHGLYISCSKQVAERMYDKLAAIDRKMLQILSDNRNVSLAMPVIITLWQARQPLVVEALAEFLRKLGKKTEDFPTIWHQAQRTVRKAMQERVREFKILRSSAYDALRVWAECSQERSDYLKGKGVYIPTKDVSPRPIVHTNNSNGHGQVSRRRQKQAICSASAPDLPQPSRNGHDKPWKVVCVNEYGKELDSLSLKLSDDGTQLAETLDLCYGWPMGAPRTMRALAKLLRAEPSSRNFVPWIPFGGINWYRLRVSKKYRILAHIKDETRSVMLIAGHKIKLVAAIGKRKDES